MESIIEMPETTLERELAWLLHEVLRESPRRGLAALQALDSLYVPWLERRLVRRMRHGGASWTGIGRIMGISRQAVQKRHDQPASMGQLMPPTLPDQASGPNREYRDLVVKLRHLREMEMADRRDEAIPW